MLFFGVIGRRSAYRTRQRRYGILAGLLLAEVADCVVKQWLQLVASDIGKHTFLPTLSVTHLTEDLTVLGDDTLYGIIRTIRVVWCLHSSLTRCWISRAESYLAILKELLSQLLTHNELTLAVADCNRMCITYLHACQPWASGSSYGSSYHLRDVAVDIVAEQGWRL